MHLDPVLSGCIQAYMKACARMRSMHMNMHAQVAMRRPTSAPALRRPAGVEDAALRRPAAALGLRVAEPAAHKPRTFASSVQELQELKAL